MFQCVAPDGAALYAVSRDFDREVFFQMYFYEALECAVTRHAEERTILLRVCLTAKRLLSSPLTASR